jgi:hypothetical protein
MTVYAAGELERRRNSVWMERGSESRSSMKMNRPIFMRLTTGARDCDGIAAGVGPGIAPGIALGVALPLNRFLRTFFAASNKRPRPRGSASAGAK